MSKARTNIEINTIKAQEGLDTFGALQGAAWYLALTKLSKPVLNFFIKNQQYLFVATLLLYFVNLFLYAVNFIYAANKNAGKTANLLYRAFVFIFYLAILGSFILWGSVIASTLYYAFCVVDPLLNVIKSIYFFIKYMTAKTVNEEEFFFNKTVGALKYAVGAALFGVAMVLLYAVAGLPLLATAAIGITFAVISILLAPLIRPWVVKGIQKIALLFNDSSNQEQKTEMKYRGEFESVRTSEYYSYGMLFQHIKPEALLNKIGHLRIGLEFTSKPEENHSWLDKWFSEHPKRRNKILALTLMENLIAKLNHLPASSNHLPLKLSDGKKEYDFYYENKDELGQQIQQHIMTYYRGAHQSWYKDVGRVSYCIHKTLELLQSVPSSCEKKYIK